MVSGVDGQVAAGTVEGGRVVEYQNSEVGSQKPEVKSRKSEA